MTAPAHRSGWINPRASIWRGKNIGLLGGSFNPAHEGHRLISLLALKHLNLDEVWWMVSPQNPLKSRAGMAGLQARLDEAQRVARHPRIRVTDIETGMNTRYTADTLELLKRRFPATRFVWMMGADNMVQIPRWQRWQDIFTAMPIAIFGRPQYSLPAMASAAAKRFQRNRVQIEMASRLPGMTPPAWVFIHYRYDPASATAIRAAQGGEWHKESSK